MATLNWSMIMTIYLEKNSSTNYTTQCAFDVAAFLRYVGTLIVILGFMGNFLSIIVFSRKTLRSRSCSMYFLALSMSDFCVLIGYTFESLLFHGYGIQFLSNAFMCKSVIFLIYASTDISNYLLTLAAIDRCVLVSHPTAHYRFCRKSVAKFFITFIVLMFSLINSHFLYGFDVDGTGACLPISMEYINFYIRHYDSYIDIIKTVLIPFIIILTCNTFIILKLTRKHSLLLQSCSGNQNRRRQEKDRQLTGFLLLSSIVFIILSLPSEINDFVRTYLTHQFQINYACELWMSTTILILLHQVNHASHFYIYTLTGPIFRKELQKLLCYFREKSPKKELNDQSRKPSTPDACTHHDSVDDQELSLFLRQTHSPVRASCRSDV
jgi:hypothetical protein